ncbi:MAG: hypothetical protein M3P27_03345 [Acidobacteriota bacterium]|nr:hypothetical protein [Acidobacteriota bacterium]
MKTRTVPHFVICIDNGDTPVDLEVGKVYRVLPDRKAKAMGLVRVVDGSGEDYLYPAEQFVPVRLPRIAQHALLKA